MSTIYTQERLFTGVPSNLVRAIKEVFAAGMQLSVDQLPDNAIIPVTLLAAYGELADLPIVDDYRALLSRAREVLKEGSDHPEQFMVSSICIMASRGQTCALGSFVTVGIDELFEDLIGRYL